MTRAGALDCLGSNPSFAIIPKASQVLAFLLEQAMSAVQYFGLITMICVSHNMKSGHRLVLGGVSLLLSALFVIFGGDKP